MENEIPNDYFGCCVIFEEENSIVRMVLISVWGNIGGSLNNMCVTVKHLHIWYHDEQEARASAYPPHRDYDDITYHDPRVKPPSKYGKQ